MPRDWAVGMRPVLSIATPHHNSKLDGASWEMFYTHGILFTLSPYAFLWGSTDEMGWLAGSGRGP